MDVEGPDEDDVVILPDGKETTIQKYDEMLPDGESLHVKEAEPISRKAGTDSWKKPNKWIAQTADGFMKGIKESDRAFRKETLDKAKAELKKSRDKLDLDIIMDRIEEALGEEEAYKVIRGSLEQAMTTGLETIQSHYDGAKQNLVKKSLEKMKEMEGLQKQIDLQEENIRLLKEMQEMHKKQAEAQQEESRRIKKQNEKLLERLNAMMVILKDMAEKAQMSEDELFEKMRNEELEDLAADMMMQEWKDGHRGKGE